jgi:hypothetical protein
VGPVDPVRRLAIVASGESRFTVVQPSAEPGRTFDEVLRWNPYRAMLRPLAMLVHQGINWLLELDHATDAGRHVAGISARSVIADALARALQSSGRFDYISASEREPIGDDRGRVDAILRLAVPEWGLVRVRDGDGGLVSSYADVRAQMTLPGTGAVVWEVNEDVTHPERLPLESFTRDAGFARQALTEVLERAGQRLASELLYARGARP